ncbi:MAG: winged helix-turn-helix domain-containing protein, partial [Lachnospiraceae bacterium]|nr:winged helix-turn-helix domain-containing protein [Lachnospiraceae bacterium]
IQCVTRRSPILRQTDCPAYCDICFDDTTNTLTGPDGSCTCSKREGAMLEIFIKNGGQTLSRNTLLLKIWGPDSDVEEGNLDNYIYFVRRRLKAVGSRLKLRTIRGIGYCLLQE